MTPTGVAPRRYGPLPVEWNPWTELRARPHIEFSLDVLPDATGGAVYWPFDGWAAIVIDARLPRRRRKAALAHELVHDERGGAAGYPGQPASWDAVVTRDERGIDAEVAARLVPQDRLWSFLHRRISVEPTITVREVADEFDVPEEVAERALRDFVLRNPQGWEAA